LSAWQWLAPEVFEADGVTPYTVAADIFSFALIAWNLAHPKSYNFACFFFSISLLTISSSALRMTTSKDS